MLARATRVILLCTALVAAGASPATARHDSGSTRLDLDVVSSRADQVSGGDARLRVRFGDRVSPGSIRLYVNGRDATSALRPDPEPGSLSGVVAGLREGGNVALATAARARPDVLFLRNHPSAGPIFSGPHQYPFVCRTEQAGLGQPIVDNQDGQGMKVFANADHTGPVVGWSRDCAAPTTVDHLYRSTGGQFKPLPADGSRPADMATTTTLDGRTLDYVVRRERGTINRFVYAITMLADPAGWNRRVIYRFDGGVAIGHDQGRLPGGHLYHEGLSLGYAILYSTGTRTNTHYNLILGGETALMVKERFIEAHGVPLYTVGVGASGGGIQQYVYGQNYGTRVIDAAIPQYSYPDMVTQTIHVGDCELLEHYMDATDRTNAKWRVTKNRSWLVGMNAEQDDVGNNAKVNDALAPLKTALGYSTAKGSTECIPAWRGLTPLAMNPLYGQAPNSQFYEPQSDIAAIRWTHYDDLRNVYGFDATGAARPTWDNVGVQYGLGSLKAGKITPAEFIHLNWNIGGWKHPSQMVQEGFPFFGTTAAEIQKAQTIPGYFDPWSRRNMNLGTAGVPAPRTAGDPIAMRAAYSSGHVFGGRLDVPTLDHRQYMERELDMHNSHQSFAVRKRVLQRMGHSDNLVVWFTDTTPGTPKASQTLEALAVMDEWMTNMRLAPGKGIVGNKPAKAVDSCFDLQGKPIYAGADAWSGILDSGAPGACTQKFPLYGTSRTVAGAPIEGGIYNCARKTVEQAVADGTYAPWVPGADDVVRLKAIFPSGVCDYGRPDQARP